MLKQLLQADRTVRRFREDEKVNRETLVGLVELTRYCASGRNLQPLRYYVVSDEMQCRKIFDNLKWAGYYADWDGPEEGERPTAYLVQCIDTQLTRNCLCDDGLQLQAITLGAAAKGIGCCIIKSFNMAGIREALSIDDRYLPNYVLALGYPAETVEIETTDGNCDDNIKYFRTPDGVHHVPKRPLDELILS
ncbi:MAG: nitroreductase family protein [Muribaculum sp.]|nr:nitroreductase family protein [Muribaculum sp.]